MDNVIAFVKQRAKLLLLYLLCVYLLQPIANVIWLWAIVTDNDRAWKMFVAFDQFGNTGLNGDPSETLSERAAVGAVAGSRGWCVLCRILDLFDKGHCAKYAPAVDGVRAETIHESSNEESTDANHLRSKAGVLLVRLRDFGRSLLAWR